MEEAIKEETGEFGLEIDNRDKCPMCNNPTSNFVNAVGSEEIVKICEDCAKANKMPVIHKATEQEISNVQKYYTKKGRAMQIEEQEAIKKLTSRKSPEDREIERVLKQNLKKGDYPDLVDHFYWQIQQVRRAKKLSQKQLAESIAEPEVMIDLAEQGKLPENYEVLINKIEQFLRIPLWLNPKVEEKQGELNEGEEEIEIKESDWFTRTSNYLKGLTEKMFKKDEEDLEGENKDSNLKDEDSENEMKTEDRLMQEKINERVGEGQRLEKRGMSERDLFEQYYKKEMKRA